MSNSDKETNRKQENKNLTKGDFQTKYESPKRNSAFKSVELRSTAIAKSPFYKIFQELEPLPDLLLLKTPKPGLGEEMVYLKTPDNRFIQVQSKMGERLDFDALGVSARKPLQTIQGENSADEYQESYAEQDSYGQQVESQSRYHKAEVPANNHGIPPQELKIPENTQKTVQIMKQAKPGKICCNCKKSRCLKLYCQCFRNNQLCSGCNCVQCLNIDQNCPQRYNAMVTMMQINPQAFCPKIQMQKHTKGCNCKKSNCLKKYCECYQAGLGCSDLCRCEDCKNNKTSINPQSKPKPGVQIHKANRILIDS